MATQSYIVKRTDGAYNTILDDEANIAATVQGNPDYDSSFAPVAVQSGVTGGSYAESLQQGSDPTKFTAPTGEVTIGRTTVEDYARMKDEARVTELRTNELASRTSTYQPRVISSGGKSPIELVGQIQQTQTPVFNLPTGTLLKQGTYNNQSVTELQKLLGITADGDFGPQTKAAVVAFQQKYGLSPDGIVGPATAAKLNEIYGKTQQQPIYDAKTGFLTPYGTSIGAKAVQSGDPSKQTQTPTTGTGGVATSTSARKSMEQAVADIKQQLEQGTDKPELFNSVAEFDKLRKEQGIVKDEQELAAIQNEMRLSQQELRQFSANQGREVSEGGRIGAINEAERNANFRMEGLALRERAVLDRVNTKNSVINTLLQLGESDYNRAKQSYDDEYNRNLQALSIYNDQLDDQQADAYAGFQTMANLLSQSGLSQLTPELSQQMDALALRAGLPMGVFQTALKGISANEQIKNTVKNGNNIYMQTVDANGIPHLKLIQTLSDGSSTGGTEGGGVSSNDVKAIQTQLNSLGANLVVDGIMGPKTQAAMKAAGMDVPTTTGGEYGSPEYVIQRLLNTAGSKTKPVASEREQLGKFSNVVALTENLMGSLDKTTNDPIIGYLKSLNPYDFDARAVNAQVTALVPSVARALYGEVGVLTDTDIERYLKTLPNIRSTTDQNKFIALMTLGNARRSYEQTLLNLANSNVNVSGFVDSYRALTDKMTQLEGQIGVAGEADGTTENQQTQNFWSGISNWLFGSE